jgi:tetratricopeptide (TPR) repeat protein
MRGHLVEGIERVQAALALSGAEQHPAARADALSAAAGLAYWLADTDRARGLYRDEIAAREALGDRPGLADAHYGISFTWSVMDLGNPETASIAEQHISRALAIYQELGDASGIGRCEWALANVLWGTLRIEEAREHASHALGVFQEIDDQFMVGWSSYTLGLAALTEDHLAGGIPAARAEARERFTNALGIFDEAEDLTGYALVLDTFAVLALRDGDRRRAARLSGAAGVLERTSGTGLNTWNRTILGFDRQELRDDPSLAGDIAAGEAMTTAEAVAYALEPS